MKTLMLLLLLASRAGAVGSGCSATAGTVPLEKIRSNATGPEFVGCINRSFDLLSSSTVISSTGSNLNLKELSVWRVTGSSGSAGIWISSAVTASSSWTFTGAGGLGVTYGVTAGSVTATGAMIAASLTASTITWGDHGTKSTGTANGVLSLPVASKTVPSLNFGTSNTGLYGRISNGITGTCDGTTCFEMNAANYMLIPAGVSYAWTSSAIDVSGADTGISRLSAAKIAIGNSANGDYSGTLIAGNVGIGTTSPATTLDVNGSAQFGGGATKSTFSATGFLTITGSTLTVASSGIITAPSQPGWRSYNSGAQNIPSTSTTELYFDTDAFDRQNIHDVTASSSSFVVPVGGDGIYTISCTVQWVDTAAGARMITSISVDGVATITGESVKAAGTFTTVTASSALSLVAGNVLKCNTYNSGSATATQGGVSGTSFSGMKLW